MLLFVDGFDHYGTGGSLITLGKWASGSLATASVSPVRTGSHALRFGSGAGSVISKVLPASGGIVAGFAFSETSFGSADNILEVREGTTVHLAVQLGVTGLLAVLRGATVLATGTTPLPAVAWSYIEFKAVIHDSAGAYELRVDGVPYLPPASGIDTRNAGATGQWDRIAIQATSSGHAVDDLYVCDLSGAIRNDFLGLCKVETVYPQTDAVAVGSNAGLTPSTGTDHGALVDETAPNTTDYNSSATVGLKDTYNYPSLALTGTILGIQTNLYAAKSDAAARQVCAVVRAGGVDYDGANVAPLTTFAYFSEVRAQNPNTAADWTSGEIDTLEAGMKVTV